MSSFRDRPKSGSSIRKIEERFARLDAIEKKLNKKKTVLRKPFHFSSEDPALEDIVVPLTTKADAPPMESKTFRMTQTVDADQHKTRSAVHEGIAHNVSKLKEEANAFLKSQEVFNSMPIDYSEGYKGVPRPENVDEFAPSKDPDNPRQFAELFMDEDAFETRAQMGLISKIVASQPLHSAKSSARPQTAGSPSQQRGVPQDGNNSPASLSHVHRAAMSPFHNPKPIDVRKRLFSAGAKKNVATTSADTFQNPNRLAASFFNQLPPVIPQKPISRKWQPKKVDFTDARSRENKGMPPNPTAFSTPSDRLIYCKEFYYLHVKIMHSLSKLETWEFSVTISDITYPERILRHTMHNLKVNNNMYLIFHPPTNVILSPSEDIPWVMTPESLFKHTLRIEVYASYPTKTKVIDTMVYYGDSVPEGLPSSSPDVQK